MNYKKMLKENRRGRLGSKGTILVRNGDRRLGQGSFRLRDEQAEEGICQFNRIPLPSEMKQELID